MSGSINLVKGADDVLREEVLAALVEKLVGDGDRSLLVDEFAGVDYELSAAIEAAQTLPFLTESRIVVARHAARFSNAETQAPLLEYLAVPLESTDLVIVWEKSPESGSKLNPVSPKLKKALAAAGAVEHDSQPPARNREAWVGEQFARQGLTLDNKAKNLVAERLGENAGAVVELVERLHGLFGPDAKLGVDELEGLLGEAGGVPPWELTDAIDRGDSALALERLQRMLGGGDRHPLQVMATLHSHYARMLRLDGAHVRSEKDAAAVLNLKGSTFPAKKALGQGAKLGHTGVSKAIGLLAEADLDLRGAQAWPDDLVMEVLIARLSRLTRLSR